MKSVRSAVLHRPFQLSHLRWYICALLFFGSMVNYLDRGTIAIVAHDLQRIFGWKESDYGWIVFAFQLAYAVMMLVSGAVIDGLGTRVGYALAMTWWSLAAMGHALARGMWSFAAARFLLGAGEAGNFPAAIKAVAEWFPRRERALSTGIFNAGTNVGAVAAYPIVGWLLLKWGWKAAFVGTGALGFSCLALWLVFYRLPRDHPWISAAERDYIESSGGGRYEESQPEMPWRSIFGYRQAWGFTLAKFMTDPIWWFYIFWLPKYLIEVRHFSIARLEIFGMIPFLAAVPGSVAGGWFSGFLMKRLVGESGPQDGHGRLCLLYAGGDPGSVLTEPMVGAGPYLAHHFSPPGLVGQRLHTGVGYFRQARCRFDRGGGWSGRRCGRHDYRPGGRLCAAVFP